MSTMTIVSNFHSSTARFLALLKKNCSSGSDRKRWDQIWLAMAFHTFLHMHAVCRIEMLRNLKLVSVIQMLAMTVKNATKGWPL